MFYSHGPQRPPAMALSRVLRWLDGPACLLGGVVWLLEQIRQEAFTFIHSLQFWGLKSKTKVPGNLGPGEASFCLVNSHLLLVSM